MISTVSLSFNLSSESYLVSEWAWGVETTRRALSASLVHTIKPPRPAGQAQASASVPESFLIYRTDYFCARPPALNTDRCSHFPVWTSFIFVIFMFLHDRLEFHFHLLSIDKFRRSPSAARYWLLALMERRTSTSQVVLCITLRNRYTTFHFMSHCIGMLWIS